MAARWASLAGNPRNTDQRPSFPPAKRSSFLEKQRHLERITVALLEASSGGFLLANAALAKIVVTGLLALLAVVAIAASRNNQQVPCNCFGMDDTECLSTATARRNVLLASFLFVFFWGIAELHEWTTARW